MQILLNDISYCMISVISLPLHCQLSSSESPKYDDTLLAEETALGSLPRFERIGLSSFTDSNGLLGITLKSVVTPFFKSFEFAPEATF